MTKQERIDNLVAILLAGALSADDVEAIPEIEHELHTDDDFLLEVFG